MRRRKEWGTDLHVKLSKDVRTILEVKAANASQSITEYIIGLILARPLQFPDIVKKMDEIVDQMRRIGVNINQIARHENAGIFDASDLQSLKQSQAELEKIILDLRKDLMNSSMNPKGR